MMVMVVMSGTKRESIGKDGDIPQAACDHGTHLRFVGRRICGVIKTYYPRTQRKVDIRVALVYLPRVSPCTHLSISPKGKSNSWGSWSSTALAHNQTWSLEFVAIRVLTSNRQQK